MNKALIGLIVICGLAVVYVRGSVMEACGFNSHYDNTLLNVLLCGLGLGG